MYYRLLKELAVPFAIFFHVLAVGNNGQLKDYDKDRNMVTLILPRAKKNRITNCPPKLKELLYTHCLAFKPKVYLMEGQKEGAYCP